MNYCQKNHIKNVLLVGLGGIGTVYANLINKNKDINLRILVDETRLEKYTQTPRILNGEICNFNYILAKENFSADLIIITTKSNGLEDVIQKIRNFVSEKTIIMSFMNGISSEARLSNYFNEENILPSYIICHSIMRTGNIITHDGITKIIFGDKYNNKQRLKIITEFFKSTKLEYEVSENILKSLWEKFCFNCCVNQISAITGYTFKEMKQDYKTLEMIKNVSTEIDLLAKKIGIKDIDLVKSTFENLEKMIPDGKTSMLQDFENNQEPEIDLFGAKIIELAKKYSLDVPYNMELFKLVKEKYESLKRS